RRVDRAPDLRVLRRAAQVVYDRAAVGVDERITCGDLEALHPDAGRGCDPMLRAKFHRLPISLLLARIRGLLADPGGYAFTRDLGRDHRRDGLGADVAIERPALIGPLFRA